MGPIRGQTRPLPVAEARHVDAKLNASIHNRFDIEVVNAETGEVRQQAQAENIILNQLEKDLTEWFGYIHIGSGTVTPLPTDTQLGTFVKSYAITSSKSTFGYGVFSVRRNITISETELVGTTISEIGIGSSFTATTLATHALLTDMNGNAITITKTSTDIINVYATVFVHWDPEKVFVLAPTKYDSTQYISGNQDLLLAACGASNIWGSVKSITLCQSNILSNSPISGATTTFPNNNTTTITSPRFTSTLMNYANLRYIALDMYESSYNYHYLLACIPVSSFYSGSDISGESLGTGDGTIKDFKTAFSMVSAVTVYVDGVPTAVTVDENVPFIVGYKNSIFKKIIILDGKEALQMERPRYNQRDILPAQNADENIYINDFCEKIGIVSWSSSGVSVSNDRSTWVDISGTNVPEAYQHYKYIKLSTANTVSTFTRSSDSNIHFAVAPPSGATITADYHTATIAKDANHVFDCSVTLQFGEHTA